MQENLREFRTDYRCNPCTRHSTPNNQDRLCSKFPSRNCVFHGLCQTPFCQVEVVQPYTWRDFIHESRMLFGAEPCQPAYSVGAGTHPKAPPKRATECLVALEAECKGYVQNRILGIHQRGGSTIHT